jgi:glycosyltransferase involved in cell wall biosynthesis
MWPVEVLQQTEPSVEFEVTTKLPVLHARDGRVSGIAPLDVDLIVLQRPLHSWQADVIPFIQRQGVGVVVEIDDDLSAMHPGNHVWAEFHPRRAPSCNWEHLARACASADLVVVTTSALARRYGRHGRVAVVPNFVSEALLEIPRVRDGKTVGWSGTVANHPQDLLVTAGGVADAIARSQAHMLIVGDGAGAEVQLGLSEPAEVTGWVEIEQYFRQMARFDVGIAPLQDSAFNAAKSALKPLELSALAVPCVISPRADYLRVHETGIGVLAGDRRKDWARAVLGLLSDEAWREEVTERSLAAVREHYLLQRNAWRFLEAWTSVLGNRRCTVTA